MVSGECAVDSCERPAERGELCEGHRKRKQRGQVVNAALAPLPSGFERLTEAAIKYANAADDDEGEFKRARDNLRKAAMAAQSAVISEWTREGMARAKANGAHVGRPPSLSEAAVRELLVAGFSSRTIAKRMGVSKRSIERLRRRLRMATQGSPFVAV